MKNHHACNQKKKKNHHAKCLDRRFTTGTLESSEGSLSFTQSIASSIFSMVPSLLLSDVIAYICTIQQSLKRESGYNYKRKGREIDRQQYFFQAFCYARHQNRYYKIYQHQKKKLSERVLVVSLVALNVIVCLGFVS